MCEKFKNSLINLNTRKFGTAIEMIIANLYKFDISSDLKYDLSNEKKKKIEIKSSRVYKKNELIFNKKNKSGVYKLIMNHDNRNLLIKQTDINNNNYKFDCNIQQIKTKLFEEMYYILLFYDVIEIFKITPIQIKNNKNDLNYSNSQHRGNTGEGQFHINNKTYSYHKDNYFYKSYTYKEIINRIKN